MFFRKKTVILLFSIALMSVACSEYQKVLKSNDVDYKYTKAIEYYEKDDYLRAYPIFEEIIPLLRGTDKAEVATYYYCYSNYYLSDYYLAGYHFKKFHKTYPTSTHAEEALFMTAYCSYINSPTYKLDQTNTKNAISDMQIFVNAYPKSTLVDSCNKLIDELRAKLELKSYNNAKLYFKTEYYKSAIIALNNTLKDFPNTDKVEEINYLILKSKFLLAINSVLSKKAERLEDVIESYYTFVDQFASSKYIKECESMYNRAVDENKDFTQTN
jgi:outer membrane protein assembly factor BamD